MQLGLLERLNVRKVIQIILAIVLAYVVIAGSYATLSEGRFTGANWRTFVIAGLALGSLYALIAMGYTLVYGILFIINFAHGEVFMAGAFTAFFLAREFATTGFLESNPVVALTLLFMLSMTVSTTIAVLNERIAYRKLRGAPRLVPLITAIGASLFLQYTFRGLYGARVRAYPAIPALEGRVEVFGILPMQKTQLVVIVCAAALMLALYLFINKTKTGRAMRAVGEDKEISSLMGIDVDRVIVTTFAIGGMLAGAAGILWALVFKQVDFYMGFLPGIKAFTAAVLGGIGNVVGAALGGILLGLMEAVAPFLLLTGWDVPSPNQLKDVIAFSVLVLVLIFKPGGILGSDEAEKV